MASPPVRPTRPSAAPIRPTRPTVERAAKSAATARIVEGEARISIRVSTDTLHAIKLAALHKRQTVKRLVLDAIRATGVELPVEPDE